MSFFCHFLIGIPGSGKSTFAQHLAKLTNSEIISTDSIRASLYGAEIIQGNWLEIEAEVIKKIKAATSKAKTVVYDATNAKLVWRKAFLEKFSTEEIEWIAWYLKTPLETCKQRNQNRSRIVPDEVIKGMYRELINFPPHVAEGFAAVNIVKPEDFNIEAIQKQL